jgi:hypothetical protein
MDLRQKIRYKTRVGLLLALLLAVLVLNSIAGRERVNKIEKTAQSIYKDRLMPSTYIFELREHLDGERALFASAHPDAATLRQQAMHQSAIADLINRYELTELTDEERGEWKAFKQHLHLLRLNRAAPSDVNEHYAQSLKSLNHLSLIQAGEGKQLKANMSSIASTSSLMSYLEIAIIIIIGGITLSLIGFSKSIFEQSPPHRPSLN